MPDICRTNRPDSITIANGATVSSILSAAEFSAGSLQLPAQFTSTVLLVQGASAAGGIFTPIWPAGGSSAGAGIPCAPSVGVDLPASAFNYGAIKITTNQTEGGLRTIGVFLKG